MDRATKEGGPCKKQRSDISQYRPNNVWTCKHSQLYIFTIVHFCHFFNYIELLIFS